VQETVSVANFYNNTVDESFTARQSLVSKASAGFVEVIERTSFFSLVPLGALH
jgi:hypothetical protein